MTAKMTDASDEALHKYDSVLVAFSNQPVMAMVQWVGDDSVVLKTTKELTRLEDAPLADCRQRPKSQVVPDLEKFQKDNIYFHNKVARIWGECVQPHLRDDENKEPWGGFDYVSLRFAGLTR